jgi:pilus assembly protein CpaC
MAAAASANAASFTLRKAGRPCNCRRQSFAIGGPSRTASRQQGFFSARSRCWGAFCSTVPTDRTELVFVITPRLVTLPADYRLPTDNYVAPTRKDLILNGRMEGERPAAPPAAPAPAAATPATPAAGGFDVPNTESKR